MRSNGVERNVSARSEEIADERNVTITRCGWHALRAHENSIEDTRRTLVGWPCDIYFHASQAAVRALCPDFFFAILRLAKKKSGHRVDRRREE